jgi:hypothetical protein
MGTKERGVNTDTFYLICCNDAVYFVVVNNESRAKAKLKELRDKDLAQKKAWGQAEYYDNTHYWHLHECSGEIPNETNEELPEVVQKELDVRS